jgi:adhesin transport system membrane fusion protein
LFILLGILVFILWASWFKIDQIVRTQGQIIPQEKTQVIQAADGGVIETINVNEGDLVKHGQSIIILESERAHANVDELKNRIAALIITRLRAQAEAAGVNPDFGNYVITHTDVVSAQRALFEQNKTTQKKERQALNELLHFAETEYDLTKKLYDTGDVSQAELMRIQRGVVDARQKRENAEEKFKTEALKEVTKVEDEITTQRSKLQERQSILDHTKITAPLDGVVKSLRINTVGGVLRPGDEIMQISPTEGGYILEAKVNPSDIGFLQIGQLVSVKLDAFDYSIYGFLDGELTYLSSDTLVEQGQNGSAQVYYRAKMRIKQPSDSKIITENIKAGMTATVDILVEKRSVLSYITKPITRAFSGALGQK